jgi:hypothetical protein
MSVRHPRFGRGDSNDGVCAGLIHYTATSGKYTPLSTRWRTDFTTRCQTRQKNLRAGLGCDTCEVSVRSSMRRTGPPQTTTRIGQREPVPPQPRDCHCRAE